MWRVEIREGANTKKKLTKKERAFLNRRVRMFMYEVTRDMSRRYGKTIGLEQAFPNSMPIEENGEDLPLTAWISVHDP